MQGDDDDDDDDADVAVDGFEEKHDVGDDDDDDEDHGGKKPKLHQDPQPLQVNWPVYLPETHRLLGRPKRIKSVLKSI